MAVSKKTGMFDLSLGQRKMAKEAKHAREKKLQSMVKFDCITYELFHMDSYEYEKYVAVMFAAKLFQANTQTNDDGLDEEVQTDKNDVKSKWTQCPPKWSHMGFTSDLRTSHIEIIGAGGDEDVDEESKSVDRQLELLRNSAKLGTFMSKAGKLMLTILEHKKRTKVPGSSGKVTNSTESNILLERGLPVLKNLRMHSLTASGGYVACSNGHVPDDNDTQKRNTSKNIVTIWSLKEPSMPLYFLRVWGHVTILRTYLVNHLVVTGNKDGSLNFWHLKEPAQYHTQYQEQLIRTPSVNTSCMGEPNHTLPVMGLEIIPESKSSALVVSVDKEKYLICWSCLFLQEMDSNGQDVTFNNHSAWSKLRVTVRHTVNMSETFATPYMEIYSFSVWKMETINFVVGTNAGFIGVGTLQEECPVYEKCYIGSNIILNIKNVHRNDLLGLIAGSCEDEYCRLFDLRRKRAILSLECGGRIIKVMWSQIRQCLLYVGQESCIEAWDLLTSDLLPIKTLPVEHLTDFATFTVADKEFIVVIAGNEMSVLTVPLNIKSLEEKEKVRFKRYISII